MKIYLVRGSVEDYSDRKEWSVCAFISEERAKKKIEELSQKARIAEAEYIRREREINKKWGYSDDHQCHFDDKKEYIREVIELDDFINQWFGAYDSNYPLHSWVSPWDVEYWIEEVELEAKKKVKGEINMPFKSKAQARFLFMKHPRIAKKWAQETPSIKRLPKKIKKKASKKRRK